MYAPNTYVASPGQTQFDLTFSYRSRPSVQVLVGGVESAFTWVNATRVQLATPLGGGERVEIVRVTDVDSPEVDFENASVILKEDLNADALQALERLQELNEVTDRSMRVPRGYDGPILEPAANQVLAWDSEGEGLVNLDPTTLITVAGYADARVETYNGNGVQTAFTIDFNPGVLANLDISVSGVTQVAGVDFTWAGTTITFTTAPPNGTVIQVRYARPLSPPPALDAAVAAAQAAAAEASDDAAATAADRVQTGLDKTATAADRVQTGLDRVATAADLVQTGLDTTATAADRVQTGLDKTATAADRVQTGLDKTATAADRVQTGLDRVATAADRVATGADRVQTGLDAAAADASADAAAASAASVSGAKIDLYRLEYHADYAYETAAAYSSSPPSSPAAGQRMVWLFDPNPANNVWFEYSGSAWTEKSAKENARWIKSRTPSLAHSPDFELWKANWNSGYNNDGLYGGLKLEIDADGVTNYNPGSDFIHVSIDGQRRFRVNNANGQTYMSLGSSNTNYLGMGHNGSGTMTLFSREYAGSGNLGVMAFLGWASTVGEVVEIEFTGTNRVHMNSAGAFVLSTNNGRYEREGYGAGRLQYIGYETASSNGKTIDFNNSGQSSYPGQIVSISSVVAGQKLLQFNSLSGSTYTEVGSITDAAVGNLTGLNLKTTTPTINMDANALGRPAIKFGANAATSKVDVAIIDVDTNNGNMRLGTVRNSYWTEIISNSAVISTFENNGNIGQGLKSYGGGVKVISEVNATTVPTSNPTGGIVRYAESGAAKVRTPGGNIVTYAPNTAISVTGSRASGAAWASLLAAMVSLGFVTDNTTA